MKTKLLEMHGWRGLEYGPGECEIPDDLAIALGLAKSAGPADLEKEADPDLEKEAAPTKKAKAKRSV